jgi:isoleucyl-tRNA synthetase
MTSPTGRFREDLAKTPQHQIEEQLVPLWRDERVFEQGIAQREGRKPFVFYEGPPTANGRPGIHHVMARTLKDVICRHRQMTGHLVRRKAGWDTHGLPVELEVEKILGISGKPEIEKLGIAKFNQACRDNLFTYKEEWERLSERMAYWLDYQHPYITCDNDYIESVWWILKKFHDAGLVTRGHKVLPYCPRCGTALSSHEVALGYKEVPDPAVTVRFRELDAGGKPTGRAFLAWTTTPWTLVSNVALAAHPDLEYVEAEKDGERLVLGAARVEALLGKEARILGRFRGKELLGRRYEPLFDWLGLPKDQKNYRVHAGTFVTADEGAGLVHMAPYGADDWGLIQREGLQFGLAVGGDGRFIAGMGTLTGKPFKDANPAIVEDLKKRGLLFHRDTLTHSYPHCWRDDGPLLYFPTPAWFIKTTAIRDKMIARNQAIHWHPEAMGTGRFGEWLENNVDWALSRDRYWGTPLPFWVCTRCDRVTVVGSRAELTAAGGKVPEDLHRPYVDQVELRCAACGGSARRVTAVADCWLDSGAVPYAQYHYPFENRELVEREQFPADYIAEGIDQTRGWFYTLHVLATFLFDQPAARNIVVNGLVLDKDGRKMSKRLKNSVDPWKAIAESGVDPLRWYLVGGSPPHQSKRFDQQGVEDVRRQLFGTLLNSHQFFATYANIDGFRPEHVRLEAAALSRPDRWILSRLMSVTREVGQGFLDFEFTGPARALWAFVEDELSNWYIRRNRDRFWSGDAPSPGSQKGAAFSVLYTCLHTVARLMAPLAPFTADALWRDLRRAGEPTSVHLADWPAVEAAWIEPDLEADMAGVLRVVALGRQIRNEQSLKTRQPLARMLVGHEHGKAARWLADADLTCQVRDELNVKELLVTQGLAEYRDLKVKPNFPVLGKKAGKAMKSLQAALGKLPEDQIEVLRAGGSVRVTVPEGSFELTPEDVQIESTPRPGFAVAAGGGYTVVLDTQVTPELLREGIAVELRSRIQMQRKDEGYRPEDRIEVTISGPAPVVEAARAFEAMLRAETLAQKLTVLTEPLAQGRAWSVNGHDVVIVTRRV